MYPAIPIMHRNYWICWVVSEYKNDSLYTAQ